MGDMLLEIGRVVCVENGRNTEEMLIIGKLVKDEEGNIHDYAGVPYFGGYKDGNIAVFEHRDIRKVGD